MNQREVAEIRRRFRAEKSNIRRVRGCYINRGGEIVSEFDQPIGETNPEESEAILGVLRKALSGGVGRNLLSLSFSTREVAEGAEHHTLNTLRKTQLADDEAIRTLYDRIRSAYRADGSYLILLAAENYDVPSYSKNGEDEGSSQIYSYILCSICPIKDIKKAPLSFLAHESRFSAARGEPAVSSPAVGFLFPSFDDRAANLYSALFYTRDIKDNHEDLTRSVFGVVPPMPPAATQKETFAHILAETVGDACSYEVTRDMHDVLRTLVEEHKAANEREVLTVNATTVKEMLVGSGVAEERAVAFERACEEAFGAGAELSPTNIADVKRMKLESAGVDIRLAPEHEGRVETRIMEGIPYILIRAEAPVTVNGVEIAIAKEE